MIKISLSPSNDVIALLKRSIIGTPGKSITYKLSEVGEKINYILNPLIFKIEKKSGIVGTCCFCKRQMALNNKNILSFYVRYFCFAEPYQKKNSAKNGINVRSKSLLKGEIKTILNGVGTDLGRPNFIYAYVDLENVRSLALSNFFEFKPVRNFSTVIYSRHKPRKHFGVHRYEMKDKPIIEHKLTKFYNEYTMFSTENVFFKDNYFVLKNGEEIVAGVQANLVHWHIVDIPGFLGKAALNFFPYLPLVNRYLNRQFKYISFEAVFYSPGRNKDLETLFDSVLAIYKMHTAMVWVDCESRLYNDINNLKKGFFASLFKTKPASVVIKPNGLSATDEETLLKRPAYISAFDLT